MSSIWREVYGAGIIFFYYIKWPLVIAYPALIFGLDYPRYWVMDLIWLYCVTLIAKDFIWLLVLKKRYGNDQ